uniref:Colipase C-terminal domain-containing protein n=1 Tax=Denticeps clupeoides TaxID=299321 RepID=A0AAY4BF12_9TELE
MRTLALIGVAACLAAMTAAAPSEKGIIINLSLYGSYYFCPCEDGLKCDTDWSIGGSITNTNFGVCVDPNAPKSSAA